MGDDYDQDGGLEAGGDGDYDDDTVEAQPVRGDHGDVLQGGGEDLAADENLHLLIPGTIKSFNKQKGWGFIVSEECSGDVFFLKSELPAEERKIILESADGFFDLTGRPVHFDLEQKDDGKQAAKGIKLAVENGLPFVGTVKSFATKAGYGFIACSSLKADVFFGKRNLPQNMKGNQGMAGMVVRFALAQDNRGKPKAEQLKFRDIHAGAMQPQMAMKGRGMPQMPSMMMGQVNSRGVPLPMPMRQTNVGGGGMRQALMKPREGDVVVGSIKSFDSKTGYGFCQAHGYSEDMYMKKVDFQPEFRERLGQMVGTPVRWIVKMTPDGKPQCRAVEILPQQPAMHSMRQPMPPMPPMMQQMRTPVRQRAYPGPPLSAMQMPTARGGAPVPSMAPSIAARKRAASGAPAAPAPDAKRKRPTFGGAPSAAPRAGDLRRSPPLRGSVAPLNQNQDLAGQILMGSIKSYNAEKGYGFITSEDQPGDIYFQRKSLPPEFLDRRDTECQADLQAASQNGVSFSLKFAPDGKAQADELGFD